MASSPPPMDDLGAEDLKLITLARGARARIGARRGAAVRDETGRTYAGADVERDGLRVGAVVLAVASAAASGARGLEAVACVGGELEEGDRGAVAALGGAQVLLCASDGTLVGVESVK